MSLNDYFSNRNDDYEPEQYDIVLEICSNMEHLDEDDFESLYSRLDDFHKGIVDGEIDNFASPW